MSRPPWHGNVKPVRLTLASAASKGDTRSATAAHAPAQSIRHEVRMTQCSSRPVLPISCRMMSKKERGQSIAPVSLWRANLLSWSCQSFENRLSCSCRGIDIKGVSLCSQLSNAAASEMVFLQRRRGQTALRIARSTKFSLWGSVQSHYRGTSLLCITAGTLRSTERASLTKHSQSAMLSMKGNEDESCRLAGISGQTS